jgi:hypothetical protein
MSDSEVESIDLEAEVAEHDHPNTARVLAGPARVSLVVTTPDAWSPMDAVELVIRDIARKGLDAYMFAVMDTETGEEFIVHQGRLVSPTEVENALAVREERDDPGGDE